MKKKISLTLIVLLLMTALVGCGGGASNTDAEKEPVNAEENKVEAPVEEAKPEEAPAEPVSYKDGTYEGVGEGMNEIKVSVEVAGGKIAKVEILEHEESQGISEPAIEQIPVAIVEKNSPDVDAASGATISSEGIMEAVKNALEAAK